MSDERGTLGPTEAHPAAYSALKWIREQSYFELIKWQEAFSSCAIEGNRLAEVCSETLRRLMDNEPVSDRYILGLVWSMRDGERLIESAASEAGEESKRPSTQKVKRVRRTRKVRDEEASG